MLVTPTALASSAIYGPDVVPTPYCHFILGFAAFTEHIPAIVGSCLDNEQHDPTTGDAIQYTTDGLLVWRKSDNQTAFTNGYRTWITSSSGILVRLNTQRFSWEANPQHLPVVPNTLWSSNTLPTSPSPNCRFANGFAQVDREIPAIIGQCLDNEHPDSSSGDIIQHTTEGLFVYDLHSGLISFTDGADTWVNGPAGLRERSNGTVFPFEPNPTGLPITPYR
jgi:hypothetical protein